MKKISKKLSLARQTVRVLSGPELEAAHGAGGGVAAPGEHAEPTTTVLRRHSDNAAVVCRLTGGVYTAPCRYTA
jgi:hypothetical protein